MRIQKSLSLFFLMILFFKVFGSNSAETGTADTLKILTYNVRNCKGLDNLVDYERIAGVIKRVDADVVALQELDSVTVRSSKQDVLAELARKTGMFPTYRASIKFQGGAYGIGILTRIKPLKTEAMPLPGKEEKRSVLLVELPKYVVCCTHFSLTSQDRAESVGIINQLAAKYTKPVFLAGDFNAGVNSAEMHQLTENWQILNDYRSKTFPANKPEEGIDFILSKKNGKHQFRVINSLVENEPVASDHLPVWVKVLVISN